MPLDLVTLNPWTIVAGIAGQLFGGDRLQGRPLTGPEAAYNPTLAGSSPEDIIASGDLAQGFGDVSRGLPPTPDTPQAPLAPVPPIGAEPIGPGVAQPSPQGPSGLGGWWGPSLGSVPVVLASGVPPSDEEWLRRALKEAKGSREALPDWAKRMLPRPRPTASQRAARAAARLDSKVGQALVRYGTLAIAGLGATGSAVVAGIGGLFYPSALGDAVPLEPITLDPRVYRRLPIPKPPKPDVITYTRRTPPSVLKTAPTGPPINPKVRPKGGGTVQPRRNVAPGAPAPAPSTPQGQNVTPAPSIPGPASRAIQRAMSNPGARNALQAMDLLSLARRGGSPSITLPPPVVTTTTLVAPSGPAPNSPPLTGLNPLLLSSPATRTSSSSSGCQCQSKKRGPARKCRQRASVVWAGGRQKGKVAGTKCLSFES